MEPSVTIAIPDLSGPAARSATLQALARHMPEPYEVVLLVEKIQGPHVPPLQNDQAIRQIVLPAPFSTPAGLNRVLATCTTPYILLLESGSIVTPGWLEKLLMPLNDPTVGISGPSTNSSWNEQKVLTGSEGRGWSLTQIDAYAVDVASRYSNQRRSLDTLYSLGDFCYLFKRSVVEQLGGFDEAYGTGPCWEIDFNTRAARAGFRAIWVADAYVHRGAESAWKAASIRHHFTRSKQLYQDRFCGLRLRGEKHTYEPHCRGEACEHFAPSALIQIALPQQTADHPSPNETNTPDTTAKSVQETAQTERSTTAQVSIPAEEAHQKTDDLPLVSCIMPTRNRRDFVSLALTYFARQDYPNLELIILDDGDDRVEDLIPPDPRIRYLALPKQLSIGAKRNMACEMAHGAIIAHWDDDDWYASHRLTHQVAPLLAGQADITGLETSCFFDLDNWQAWTCSPALHRRLFVSDVHGGTLVYWRKVWEKQARYPAVSLAEDAYFLQQAHRRGARLLKLPHAHSFVYLRHGSNAWRFPVGSYLQPADWQRVALDVFLPLADQPFYEKLAPHKQPISLEKSISAVHLIHSESTPLVSCIMPTYNRRHFVTQAITYFLRQDYPNKELIILDDGTDAVEDLVPPDERITYLRLPQRLTVGAKRNLACEQAKGSIIAHWDDDDWHAAQRLYYQIEMLLRQNVDLCGINKLLFYDSVNRLAWQYLYPASQKVWLAGSTLCYKRDFWANNRFANISIGEDARFVWSSRQGQITILEDADFHVGIIHQENVSPKRMQGSHWHAYQVEAIQSLLGADWDFYHTHQDSA